MDFNEFNRQYKLSRARIIAGQIKDLDGLQTHLRQLADELPGSDQEAAGELIDSLPALVATLRAEDAKRSPEMREALRIIDEGKFDEGTREERLAAYAEARKQIWALADRAGKDTDQIRRLTRGLESSENDLEENIWPDLPPDNHRG
jgi:hypothetical protein